MFDLIIAGGRLFSPADNINEIGDIGIKDGKIAAIGEELEAGPETVILDGTNCYVSPGFIDMHIHGYAYNTDYGTFPDNVGVKVGVTTAVDQGSAGCLTFPGFKHFMIEPSKTRVFSFINIGASGTLKGSMLPPLHSPQGIDYDLTIKTIQENLDTIKGIKTHAEMGGYSRWGLEVLRVAKKASRETGVPLYVHVGKLFSADEDRLPHPDVVLPEAVQLLDRGDFLAHCFTGKPGGLLNANGKVHPEVVEAIRNGVLLDLAYGEHFSFEVAEKVLDQGIKPYTISSDVHAEFNKPHSLEVTFGLNQAMSRMMALGFSLEEVVEMVTSRPSHVLGLEDEIGHLRVGGEADITLFNIESGEYLFADPWGTKKTGDKRIVAKGCVKAGEYFSLDETINKVLAQI